MTTLSRRLSGILVAVLVAIALVLVAAGVRRFARARTVQLTGRLVAHVETGDSVVALTFDDGPVPEVADTLIALLRAHRARATFFVTGRSLAAAPEVGRALLAEGHELGNHSWSHRRLVLVSTATVRDEVERADSVIHAVGERGPILFRPPYGYKLIALPRFLARTGRTTIMWDLEPDSYPDVAATPEGIVTHVLARVRPGSIILLHPWYDSRATTRAAIPALVDSLHARGYRVTTVGELLAARGPAGRM